MKDQIWLFLEEEIQNGSYMYKKILSLIEQEKYKYKQHWDTTYFVKS
jgi:hypothetical protein